MSMGVSRASGKQSLCWECKNISCPWIKSGKPVKGWQAKETVIPNPEKDIKSYNVTKCPEFKTTGEMEQVRCKHCGKLLFERETRKIHDVVTIKCPRCKHLAVYL